MNDDLQRNVAADEMAVSFLVEILLVDYFKKFRPEDREAMAATIIATGQRTDHFSGLDLDDTMAEALADVTVRMHEALVGIVSRALARLRDVN